MAQIVKYNLLGYSLLRHLCDYIVRYYTTTFGLVISLYRSPSPYILPYILGPKWAERNERWNIAWCGWNIGAHTIKNRDFSTNDVEEPLPCWKGPYVTDVIRYSGRTLKISGLWVQNEQNVTDIRKWLYAPNFRDMQPSTPIFAVVSHPKVVTEPVATLSIVFHYPTNVALKYTIISSIICRYAATSGTLFILRVSFVLKMKRSKGS